MNRSAQPVARRALTLLELMIAVAITVTAGLALSTVMTTVARSITSTTDSRSALQRAHAAFIRLRAFTDPGLCLLQHEPERGFVIWLRDETPGGAVNLREMRAFWINSAAGMLVMERVEFPQQWPEELKQTFDVALGAGADFLGEMEAQRLLGYTVSLPICDGLLGVALTHDGATPQRARRMWVRFAMDDSSQTPPEILTAYAFFGHRQPQ